MHRVSSTHGEHCVGAKHNNDSQTPGCRGPGLSWIEKDTSVLYNRKQAVAAKPHNVTLSMRWRGIIHCVLRSLLLSGNKRIYSNFNIVCTVEWFQQ